MNRERVCDTQDCEPASETLITSCTPDASGTSPQQFCAGSAKLVPLHASATHRDGACAVSVWFSKKHTATDTPDPLRNLERFDCVDG